MFGIDRRSVYIYLGLGKHKGTVLDFMWMEADFSAVEDMVWFCSPEIKIILKDIELSIKSPDEKRYCYIQL